MTSEPEEPADRRRARRCRARAPCRRPPASRSGRRSALAARRRCRRASRSAPSCTACWRRPTSPLADLDGRARRAAIATVQARRAVDDRRPGGRRRRAWRAAIETPLGPLLGGLCACATSRARPARRARLRAAAGRRRPARAAGPTLSRDRRGAARAPAGRRPAGRLRATGCDDAGLRQRVRGYLTGSLDLVVRAPATASRPRFAVLDYKTNWLARARRAADRLALPARRRGGRDAAPPLRAAGAAVPGRAAPLPALAAARLRPGRTWPGSLYLFVRGMSGPDAPVVDGARAACSRWRPPAGLVGGAERRPRRRRRPSA